MKYWRTKEGEDIALVDLTNSHLENIIKMVKTHLEKLEKVNIPVYTGKSYFAEKVHEEEERQLISDVEDYKQALNILKTEKRRRINQEKQQLKRRENEIARLKRKIILHLSVFRKNTRNSLSKQHVQRRGIRSYEAS